MQKPQEEEESKGGGKRKNVQAGKTAKVAKPQIKNCYFCQIEIPSNKVLCEECSVSECQHCHVLLGCPGCDGKRIERAEPTKEQLAEVETEYAILYPDDSKTDTVKVEPGYKMNLAEARKLIGEDQLRVENSVCDKMLLIINEKLTDVESSELFNNNANEMRGIGIRGTAIYIYEELLAEDLMALY